MQTWRPPHEPSLNHRQASPEADSTEAMTRSQRPKRAKKRPSYQSEATQELVNSQAKPNAWPTSWRQDPSGSIDTASPRSAEIASQHVPKARAEPLQNGQGSLTFAYRAHEAHVRRQHQEIAAQFGSRSLAIQRQPLPVRGTQR